MQDNSSFLKFLVENYGVEIFSAEYKAKLVQVLVENENANAYATPVALLRTLCVLDIPQKIYAIKKKNDLYKLNKVFLDAVNDLYKIFFIPQKKAIEMVSVITKLLKLQKYLNLDTETQQD